MVLGVLRRLCLVLLLDRGRAVLVRDRAVGDRAGLQGRQHALGFLVALAHRRRVEQQHGRTLGARQARRRDHRLDDAVERRQQLVDPAEQRLELRELEHPRVVGHRPRQRIRAQMEARDHAEEPRPGAASGPQKIRVLLLVGPDQLAVGRDDVDRGDVLARPAALAAVPPLAALQQEAPDPDARAVPTGKRAAVRGQERHQLGAALHRGARGDDPSVRVICHLAHQTEVDQQRLVAHTPGGPAVTAGAHRHLQAPFAGEPDAGDDVIVAVGHQHGSRVALGPAGVEHPAHPRLLIAGVAPPDDFARRGHEISDWPPSTTMSTAFKYAASSLARNRATRRHADRRAAPARPSG